MSVAQLEYFIAVAEEEHLTRAAARLHISQPPLTRQIRSLEEELGAPLFQREARGMKLLPAGRIFLREARDIVARIRALPVLVNEARERRTENSKRKRPDQAGFSSRIATRETARDRFE